MVVTAAIYMLGRVSYVQHFMKDDVFDDILWNTAGIERSAYRNVVVGGIVMTEYPVRLSRRPGKDGLWDRAGEV
jgi:hypothetical protein